jgi:hypothetical protein
MVEYQIQSGGRQCCVTNRPLAPGETCFSALLEEKGNLVRRDYCKEAWQGPPAGSIGYWQSRIATKEQPRKLVIDDDVLMECFTRLEEQQEPSQVSFRYVVSLLLMRRKRLKFEDVLMEDDREVLCLRCPVTKAVHHVVNPALSDEAISAVQDEVFKVLGWQ